MKTRKTPTQNIRVQEKNKSLAGLYKRSAGILLHITSLPSKFGIGDFGSEAYLFADFLERTGQSHWQILPLNPTDISPYSAISAMAGNVLLISPEILFEQGLLDDQDLLENYAPNDEDIDFARASEVKSKLLSKAYLNFSQKKQDTLQQDFSVFCSNESCWLDDYVQFVILKQIHQNKPWYEWPAKHKYRYEEELNGFVFAHHDKITELKWQQFVFHEQWGKLKKYCNNKGISIIGDLPIYVSHDSVDVWKNPAIFSLDSDGKLAAIAGVPPDYFSTDGQLWGMPVFNWEVLKNSNYAWWIARIKKNISMFNLVRIDHFRAFANFWEVPAGEPTAINGTWKPALGLDFFQTVKKSIGSLPFIAEDLGEIDQDVIFLRDRLKLPGMKILQFAFDKNMGISNHIPHNYTPNFVVYTGTHDNNTTLGWFLYETGKTEKSQLSHYVDKKVSIKNINKVMACLAYASIANLCILPMQDILNLDNNARMNTPGSMVGNWEWRLKPNYLSEAVENQLRKWVKLYNR